MSENGFQGFAQGHQHMGAVNPIAQLQTIAAAQNAIGQNAAPSRHPSFRELSEKIAPGRCVLSVRPSYWIESDSVTIVFTVDVPGREESATVSVPCSSHGRCGPLLSTSLSEMTVELSTDEFRHALRDLADKLESGA